MGEVLVAVDRKVWERIKGIVVAPKLEWPIIAAEHATVQSLFTRYALPVALLPSLVGFVFNGLLAGEPVGTALTWALSGYVFSLVIFYITGLAIAGLLPHVGAQRDRVQALKVATFTFVPLWLGGTLLAIGSVWLLLLLLPYGFYLLYQGLMVCMVLSKSQAMKLAALTCVVSCGLLVVIIFTLLAAAGTLAILGGGLFYFLTM